MYADGTPETRYHKDGTCLCHTCGKQYNEHPYHAEYPMPASMHQANREYRYRRLCNGDLVSFGRAHC